MNCAYDSDEDDASSSDESYEESLKSKCKRQRKQPVRANKQVKADKQANGKVKVNKQAKNNAEILTPADRVDLEKGRVRCQVGRVGKLVEKARSNTIEEKVPCWRCQPSSPLRRKICLMKT